MIFKVAIPGKIQFKIIKKEPSFFMSRQGDIHYIGGTEVLPPPLETEKENQVISDLGTEYEDEAKSILIEHNLRLVVYIAKKFENTGLDVEDLISVGTIGLIKAVNSFDNSRNIKLATYASRCIENEILMLLRKMVKVKNEVSIEEPLNVDGDGNQLLLCDVLGTEEDVVYEKIESDAEKDVLLETFKTLTERERDIISLRFGLFGKEEMTQKDIADMMGISQSYISRLEKKVVKKLRKEIVKLV